jgi:hypothetical protein
MLSLNYRSKFLNVSSLLKMSCEMSAADMNAWLKCSIEPGMLPGEYAVETETVSNGKISLFAPEDKVSVDRSLLRVLKLHDGNGSGVLVRLPAQPFEISSQNVRVPRNNLVNE